MRPRLSKHSVEATMTVLRGFVITIASGVALGCLGALIGYLLGAFVPDYYRVVFTLLAGHYEAIGGRLINNSPFSGALFRAADRP